jgi:TRAP-type mannitol/chloroaromatic compound transport system permease small subunit
MAGVSESSMFGRGEPAPGVRMFGWFMLAAMAAFLINTILTFWVGLPGVGSLFGWQSVGEPGILMWLQVAIYILLPAAGCVYALRTPHISLRKDGERVSNLNAFLVRAAFWIVLLVGLTDAAISFLRVEGFLPDLFGEQMALDLGKSQFRGKYIHVPVAILGILIACVTRTLGFIWLALLVVGAELLIVFSRFIFSYEQSFMGDLVRFWYAALFLFASAYTLLEDGHVRVDVFYSGFRRAKQGRVNAIGSILLGMTLCWTILLIGMWGKSSVIISPILIFETTQTGFGMYVKYFMAGFLGIFAISMMIQFVSSLFDSVADMRGEPGGREHQAGHVG